MADNSNYPPAGIPFPFPFPQMQQPPNSTHQDGQPQHAPPPPPGWNVPGLQQFPSQPYAPQPGHAENLNSLPPFPSAGLSWPPQIPTEWLQMMQTSMQAGMVPPPLPGISFPPPSHPHTPQAPATPVAFSPFPPQLRPQPAAAFASAASVERLQEVMDSDREDGEVSDAEASSRMPAGIAMRHRYPEPPRSAPQPAATSSRAEETYNPDRPSLGQKTPQVSVPKVAPQQSVILSEVDQVQLQREEAKQFIRLLNANNVGYHALAKENIDVELLRSMYRSMNLPSEPEPIPLPKTNGAAANPSAETQPKAVSSVSTNIAAASAASAAASPVDRKDYLARLQAAKLARQTGPAKASPSQKSPPATAVSPAPENGTPQATMTPTRKSQVTDEQKARQTELIKQRLEALKAQSKQAATQKSGLSQSPQLPPAPSANAPAPQTPAPSFSNIPGLFMHGRSSSGNGASTPSSQPQAVPQKRPAPSDTSVSTPPGSVMPYNRQFGQSPHPHNEDSMIIEVSDDESNGSDMDIDEDQGSSTSTAIRQAPTSIPGFTPRQYPVPAAASAMSTPGPQTPATLARTGELSTKEQELAALKLTLKKKLAEQKRIKEAAEAASAATTLQQGTPSKQAQLTPLARTQEAAAPATGYSRDRKRRRRTEIQEQLPTLDDEIASNEAEMARLAKDLERLKANNERIMQDKQRLTKELEDLGIDTEGMSHADMRATKNEIERAISPENEAAPQTDLLPSALPLGEEPGAPITASAETGADQGSEMSTTHTAPSNSSQPTPLQYGLLPGLGRAASQASASTNVRVAQQPVQEQCANPVSNLQSTASYREPPEGPDRVAARNDRASATPMDDDEDFYSPPPLSESGVNVKAAGAEVPKPQAEQAVMSAPSPSEEGEVEMSESSEGEDEEEYEPEEDIVEEPVIGEPIAKAPPINDPDPVSSPHQGPPPELQVEQPQSIGQSQVSTEDEEAYEPPDVNEEMTEGGPAAEIAQAETVVPEASSPGDADDGAMDIATSSEEESDDSDSESDEETQSELGGPESQTRAASQDDNIADDLAPELQLETSVATVPATRHIEDVPVAEEESEPPRFTPYQSPLRMFKSYRYHPQYLQDVDGGFLSMTFSHQIDAEKLLCPFESAGGSCNDPECPNQHFRGMGITGEKLLLQLGTANPGKTQEEKQQWNDGLRSVLKDLRQRNIKDPNGIAREIAKYRRQFLNDDTRVVNL
ncbi:uncharacterized protein M421DRAFT_417653 [Didymella exigua CBS 183.55]|uniref:Putative zinc-finger domain-containing protein n=1 Tax=Didymella exigua CBS 183.55 TaxID=1150837 RepID=A0A6A5RX48_9PLEO|nr:uncharacterized protein M421DRAFT_417653 [Didymella exigua CBS 183.55]KAF1931920.1 hypothetical protein M421DRAFT_417653 [Didymella exigua CBS 183.55]